MQQEVFFSLSRNEYLRIIVHSLWTGGEDVVVEIRAQVFMTIAALPKNEKQLHSTMLRCRQLQARVIISYIHAYSTYRTAHYSSDE